MARGIRLKTLAVEWLEAPSGRYNIGLRWRCPLHTNGGAHWLAVWLTEPYDGLPPIRMPGAIPAAHIPSFLGALTGGTGNIGAITLTTPAGGDTLDFGDCGRMRIIRGRVTVVG